MIHKTGAIYSVQPAEKIAIAPLPRRFWIFAPKTPLTIAPSKGKNSRASGTPF
jgi:hypothetical protein